MDEDALIEQLFAPLAIHAGADALRDDAAAFAGGEGDLVVTCDALAEGVHYFADDPADAIAAKALRVNLSDLTAKGAEPFGYLLALALGAGRSLDWVRDFARGLERDNARYGVSLMGGDTLRAPAGSGTVIAVTAFGRVPAGRIVRRRTARPGDLLTVTGTIGDAALGLAIRLGEDLSGLPGEHLEALREAYLYPKPPVAGFDAVRRFARAAMDVSDGLAGDCAKLCRTAGVAATIEAESVPHSPAVAAAIALDPRMRDRALTGGDDYQVLAAVAPDRYDEYAAALGKAGVSATRIGEVREGSGVEVRLEGRDIALADGRFRHF